ncbi:MAG: NAD(P)/FAD-dependent oxidoreductase [Ruminococcaceae bacterium]|nr:NAD(P)/FAD-dependent oxidoreductase [Oscillospiraceae bacterium]
MKETKTALIIGAGPAGLTAAYELLIHTDIRPTVIEEDSVLGGISRTVEHNGNRIDIGGHRFFTKNEEVKALWQELMPRQGKPARDDLLLSAEKPLAENGPDPEQEDRVMLVRRRVSRIYYLHSFFDYPITLKPSTLSGMGFGRTVKAGCGYVWSCIHKLPEDSLRNFYINRFGKPLYEMFFEDYTKKVWGVDPANISADWGAQRVKGLSLSRAVWSMLSKPFRKKDARVETSLIEQYDYPKLGPGQLYETLARRVEELGGRIVTSCAARRILMDGQHITGVETERTDGTRETLKADLYFSSMPVKDLIDGMGDVPPADVRRIAHALPYRDFMTVGLLVDRLELKNKTKLRTVSDIVPDCWIYIQDKGVRLGRLQIFNNWSPYMVKDPENTVWIGLEYFCNEGDELWQMTDEAFVALAIDELARIGIIQKDAVRDSVRLRIKKAYPAYFGSYAEFDTVKEYLSGIDNLWCIGRNGQHRYNNMDHSMLTAIEAVRAVKRGETDRSVVWSVNTEQEYHEEKSQA